MWDIYDIPCNMLPQILLNLVTLLGGSWNSVTKKKKKVKKAERLFNLLQNKIM